MLGVRGVICDIGGVLQLGATLLPGAAAAVQRLRAACLPLRFLTNTTRRTRRAVVEELARAGLELSVEEVLSSPLATRRYLEAHNLHPFLLVHPGVEEELADLAGEPPDAVVVGDAGEAFTYARLNRAFRLLLDGAPLLAMARNRYFQEPDGPSLDAGPFIAALEEAAGVQAVLLGKPSPALFLEAARSLGLPPGEVLMVGDDVESDVNGALAAGLRAVLVRTGKYRPGDEARVAPGGRVMDDLTAVVDALLG
jgi:HAD superfamily hydrolase (TIGR01458 family)